MVEPAQPIVCSPGRFVISVRSPDGATRHPGFYPESTAIPDFATLNPGYFAYRLGTSHASSWMASACFARRWRGRKKMLATKVGTMALPMTAATNAEYCD